MANDLQTAVAVNQKLAFARILIDSANALSDDESIPTRQSQHALLDGASSQLYDALKFFVLEIAEDKHSHMTVKGIGIADLINQLQTAGVSNALLYELDDLVNQPSWLRDLIESQNNPQFLAALFTQQTAALNNSANTNSSLLATDKQPSMGPLATVQIWLTNIQNLIERQRSQAIEE